MIIRDRRLIFVHIQKTGGSAISAALEQKSNLPEKHFFASDLRDLYGPEVWNECFKFAFVRNPWDRLVSWWSMIDGHREKFENGQSFNKFQSLILQRARTFEEFIENCDEEVVDNDGRKWIFRNQIEYLTDSSGRILVDFIGRFERLQSDFDMVGKRIFGAPVALRKLNASKHRHYSQYFTPRLVEKVARRYERDIAAFGYEFAT